MTNNQSNQVRYPAQAISKRLANKINVKCVKFSPGSEDLQGSNSFP